MHQDWNSIGRTKQFDNVGVDRQINTKTYTHPDICVDTKQTQIGASVIFNTPRYVHFVGFL